jgi:WD40 repeat protein
MIAKLVALDGGPDILLDRPSMSVGRHPACDARLESLRVSRRHCRIAREDSQFVVRDLGSTNGIKINGTGVQMGRLMAGDVLSIAQFRYRLEELHDGDDIVFVLPPPKRFTFPEVPEHADQLEPTMANLTDRLARREAIAIIAAIAVLLGGIAWLGFRGTSWRPRAVLRGEGDTWPLGFTPGGRSFATSSTTGITVWDMATGRPRGLWPETDGANASMAAFSPDGSAIATIDFFGPGSPMAIKLRDASDGRLRWALPTPSEGAYAILFTAAGKKVRAVVGVRNSSSGEIVDIDVASGRELLRRRFGLVNRFGARAVSPDGRLMAFLSGTAVILWDLETDSEHAAPVVASAGATASSAGFSHDGSALAIGVSNGSIEIWNLAALKHVETLSCHEPGVSSAGLQFSADDQTLASWGQFSGSGSVLSAVLDSVGRAIGSGPGARHEVVVIDLGNGERVGVIPAALHPSFSPDGRMLAVRDSSLAIKLFDLPARGSVEP